MAAAQSAPAETGKLKVFLSYSRKDSAFAQELLAGLELLGFEAYLDKEDIAPGEPWEARLGNLIRMADTVVFVISPNSLASKHCTWEVEETARVAKRLVPVMLDQVQDHLVPERLRKLNYVFFLPGVSFSKGLRDLSHALRADAGWIREHTRLGELAARWTERGKPEPLLLRGSDLADIRRWLAERPNDAPEVSAAQDNFIAASVAAEAESFRAKARTRRRTILGLTAAVILLAGLSVLSGLMWFRADSAKSALAESNTKLESTIGELKITQTSLQSANLTLEQQSAELAEANTRLLRELSLRIAPYSTEAYDVGPGWYLAATQYAGAVGFVVRRSNPGSIVATGVAIDADALDPRWRKRPVFVTVTYVVSANPALVSIRPEEAAVMFVGPKGERHLVELGEVLWESDRLQVSVSSLATPLPAGSSTISRLVADPKRVSQILKADSRRPVLVSVGNLLGRDELTLSIQQMLAYSGDALIEEASNTRAVGVTMQATGTDISYTKASLPGASGSPMFDADTGELVAIHQAATAECQSPPIGANSTEDCVGLGTSMPRIVAAIRAEPAGR